MCNFSIGDKVRLNELGRSIHVSIVHGRVVTVKGVDAHRNKITIDWSEAGTRFRQETIDANRFELVANAWKVAHTMHLTYEAAEAHAAKLARTSGKPVQIETTYVLP